MENSKTTPMLPIEGASKYYLAEATPGDTRVFSVTSKKFLSRHRYGLRWRSQVRTDENKVRWVYLDRVDHGSRVPLDEAVAQLRAEGALPLPGFPDYLITPEQEVFRINPAKRGPSAGGLTKAVAHFRSGSPYIQLPARNGRRSTFSVAKLWRGAVEANEE
jgi:hypothetical protein